MPSSEISSENSFPEKTRHYQGKTIRMREQLDFECLKSSVDLDSCHALDGRELPCTTWETVLGHNTLVERRNLNSTTTAKWAELKKLRDCRKAMTRRHTVEASLRTQDSPPFKDTWKSTAENNSFMHKRPDASEEEAAARCPFDLDLSDSTEPRDPLAPQPTPRHGSATGDGFFDDQHALRCAARRVRFAAQLEQDPPAALHSPHLGSGGRGAYAARMLRAVSRSLTRALRRARG